MTRGRLEAFSDGVLAIAITVMVLEMKVPQGAEEFSDLKPIFPIFLSYILSFVYLGIYWNNHHHMFQTVHKVTGSILWANLHLLFWLSLVPFVTHWLGQSQFAKAPSALYGFVLLMSAIAYYLLQLAILSVPGGNRVLRTAIGDDLKGKASPIIYVIAIASSFLHEYIANALYSLVALIWLIPDRRIERTLSAGHAEDSQR